MLKHGILGLLNYGDMTGYEIMISRNDSKEGKFIFAGKDIINKQYPIPSAFAAYASAIGIKVGKNERWTYENPDSGDSLL